MRLRTTLSILLACLTVALVAARCGERPSDGDSSDAGSSGDAWVVDDADSKPGDDAASPCGPSPLGCQSDADCDEGEVCASDPNDCAPSTCMCDESRGQWACSADCGGKVCQPADDDTACEGPNPAGCESDEDCADGEVCADDPDSCDPSSCSCDESSGSWTCTDDCGGTVCQPENDDTACEGPNPAGCETDEDCADGEVCADDPDSCDPSSCSCDESSGTWTCTDDCGGTVCQPENDDTTCEGPNPAGCETDEDCDDSEVCTDDPDSCDPSSCECNSGEWICTEDCGGTVCMREAGACSEENPAGCESDEDCADGEVCTDDPDTCVPSECSCDTDNDTWICTRDCGGGVCSSR